MFGLKKKTEAPKEEKVEEEKVEEVQQCDRGAINKRGNLGEIMYADTSNCLIPCGGGDCVYGRCTTFKNTPANFRSKDVKFPGNEDSYLMEESYLGRWK